MTPQKHPQHNTLVHAPTSWDDRGGKFPLPPALYAMQGKLYGVTMFLTRWKPTQEEVAMLLQGGEIELACIGGQPACSVTVQSPNQLLAPLMAMPN